MTELEQSRQRMRKRIQVAFNRENLLIKWPIPDEFAWFVDNPATRTICRKLRNEADIRENVAPHCPRVLRGELPACEHVEEVVDLWKNSWGLAVFLTSGVTDENPVVIPEHLHEVNEKLFIINGRGLFFINDQLFRLEEQYTFEIEAGDVHGAILYHPTRVIAAYQTVDGQPSHLE